MAGNLKIDATGMNNMIRSLKKYNNVQTRVVVRAVTKEILANAAKKTKTAKAKAVTESVDKNFRRPHEVAGVGFVGITRSGKVWANLARWGNKKKWILINEDGKLKNPPAEITRTGRIGAGRKQKLAGENRALIKRLVQEGKAWRKRELAYRKSKIGMSKATWYHLMRILRLKIPANAPKKPQQVKLPPSARAALRAWETTSSRDNYSINIKNAVQAALNPNARGIGAFAAAFNGKVKEFERAALKDAKGFAKKFADRNGFEVK